jgi:Cof subfamily protein (haloacid dehalogenase superfamily)
MEVRPGEEYRLLDPEVPWDLPARPALVVVDVDGTLLNTNHDVGMATIEEMGRVRREGMDVLLASSRGPRAMLPILQQVGLVEPAVFIGSQGAFTGSYDEDGVLRTLDREPLPLSAARQVVLAAHTSGLAVSWYSADRWLVSRVDATIEREAQIVRDDPEVRDLMAEGDAPDKIMIIARGEADLDVLRALARELPGDLRAQVSNPTYLEVTHRDVDKSSAVRRHCTKHGIDPAAVVAIGDGPNDLGLFAYVGTSVAPANARDEVLAAADWITRSNDDDGVAWALRTLSP